MKVKKRESSSHCAARFSLNRDSTTTNERWTSNNRMKLMITLKVKHFTSLCLFVCQRTPQFAMCNDSGLPSFIHIPFFRSKLQSIIFIRIETSQRNRCMSWVKWNTHSRNFILASLHLPFLQVTQPQSSHNLFILLQSTYTSKSAKHIAEQQKKNRKQHKERWMVVNLVAPYHTTLNKHHLIHKNVK